MRFLIYKLAVWVRDSRQSGYLRPILVTSAITAAFMAVYKSVEHALFPDLTLMASRVTSIGLSSALAGLMAFVALRIYRRMAQETIEELTERLRLSEELLGERNLSKSLMETAVDRIYFKDLDGRFIRVSASVAAHFGLAYPREVVGRSDRDFYVASFARQLRQDEESVARTGVPAVGRAYREVLLDGREAWSSVTLVPLRDRHGHVIGTLGVARDITEARRQEQRLRQLSRAVEQNPAMVLITDREGRIEYVNPIFTEITGYAPDEVLGRTPALLKSGNTPPEVYRQLWGAILAGSEWRGRILNKRKDGETYWAKVTVAPIRELGGETTHFVAVSEDVTLEERAAEQLEQESARRRELERIIGVSPAVAFLWRNAPGWPVEYVSDNVRRWGYTAEAMLREAFPFSSLVCAEDALRVADEVVRFTAEGRDEFIQEYRIVSTSGALRWVEDRTWVRRGPDGSITHFQGVVVDISDRKRAELAQQAMADGLRTVLEIADELMGAPDEATLHRRAVELARARLDLERCAIFLLDGQDLVGTFGTDDKGHTTDEHDVRFAMEERWMERAQCPEGGRTRWMVNEENRRFWEAGTYRDAGRGWVATTVIPSSERGLIGIFCNDAALTNRPVDPVKQDVVAVYCSLIGNMLVRKRAEQEQRDSLSRGREMMERTDRLNSLGVLAAGMAHEINNPLQGMLSHVHAVQRSLPRDAPSRKNLEMVERGIDTIAVLVRKLLTLGAADEGGEMAVVQESVSFVTQLLGSQLRRAHIELVRDVSAEPIVLAMPRRELIQVLLNLMINARDAMKQGGTLAVSVREEGGYAEVRVADTGEGIQPEIMDRIFTPFFTTKGTRGTGLGLSVAESLVRSRGGSIKVQSVPGGGATFLLMIPAVSGAQV